MKFNSRIGLRKISVYLKSAYVSMVTRRFRDKAVAQGLEENEN